MVIFWKDVGNVIYLPCWLVHDFNLTVEDAAKIDKPISDYQCSVCSKLWIP